MGSLKVITWLIFVPLIQGKSIREDFNFATRLLRSFKRYDRFQPGDIRRSMRSSEWSEWTEYSDCSVTCGLGSQKRIRECKGAVGSCIGSNTMTKPCQLDICNLASQWIPEWEPWTEWSTCSVSCGRGSCSRSRQCKKNKADGCAGEDSEKKTCSMTPCHSADDSFWKPWNQWSSCSKMCDGGLRSRKRECSRPGCIGEDIDEKPCNTHPCCTKWSPWGPCSVTCEIGGGAPDRGVEKRMRRCMTEAPSHGQGLFGFGYASIEDTETRPCRIKPPLCAQWSPWSAWTPCSSTCGQSFRTQRRICSAQFCPGDSEQQEPCRSLPCPEWSAWGEWTVCDANCGGGTRERRRSCSTGGGCPGKDVDIKTCNNFPCPTWSNWGPWTKCSESCNGGFQVRSRVCSQLDGCGGDAREKRLCNEHRCPLLDQWQPWGRCSEECGGGVKKRKRPCVTDSKFCLLDEGKFHRACQCEEGVESLEPCNTHKCPVLTVWSSWGKCSSSCGGGFKERYRKCEVDTIYCSGFNATLPGCNCNGQGILVDSMECNTHKCPHWGVWEVWGRCSASCNGGTRTRKRPCVNDPFICEGASNDAQCRCEGAEEENELCNPHECPHWESWSPWLECSADCGGGQKTRARLCTVDDVYCADKPIGDKSCTCDGNDFGNADCNMHQCSRWEIWGEWSECSESCGGGMQKRGRKCLNDPLFCTGTAAITNPTCKCVGEKREKKECNTFLCPGLQDWSPWTSCTATCGGGRQHRERKCKVDPEICGVPVIFPPSVCQCEEALEEFSDCNTFTCPVWMDWSQWSLCSTTCGPGQKDRKRTCETDDRYCVGNNYFTPDCQCNGRDVELNSCTIKPCFTWSSWSDWSSCTKVCGGGSRTRSRDCPQPGACPGINEEKEFCNQIPCPDWGAWSEWSSCSVSCGGGQRARTRSCPIKDACIPGEPYEAESCNPTPCAVWEEWGDWSPCSASCGEGHKQRYRKCSSFGCLGHGTESDLCFLKPCDLFTHWSAWSPCSKTCGGGSRSRSRVTCPTCRPEDDYEVCEEQECPVWSEWSPYTDCSASCGGGHRDRSRICVDPKTQEEKPRGCVGKKVEVDPLPCNPQSCRENKLNKVFQPWSTREKHVPVRHQFSLDELNDSLE